MSKVSVKSLFEKFDLEINGPIQWGEPVDYNNGGIYVVSTSDNPTKKAKGLVLPDINLGAIEEWQKNTQGLKLCKLVGQPPEPFSIELQTHWISGETIIYIGEARNLGKRLRQFYRHKIGHSSPHSGGQWIKTLNNLNDLFIYYSLCSNHKDIEFKMLLFFAECVTGKPYLEIENLANYIPFGNLEIKLKKNHNISR